MSWEEYSSFSSSNIQILRYNSDTSTLEVTFHSGGVYQYFDLPLHVWNNFKTAESKGSFLNKYIKGYYRYSRV